MEMSTAISLIQPAVGKPDGAEIWADLGAGTGMFTKALAQLLSAGSTIYAIDQDKKALEGIVIQSGTVSLKKMVLNFAKTLDIEPLDGILMANALHFIREKTLLINNLKQRLKGTGKILIIEYDRQSSNPWVPYPIPYLSLEKLATEVGATSIRKVLSTPSSYDDVDIYSALLSFQMK